MREPRRCLEDLNHMGEGGGGEDGSWTLTAKGALVVFNFWGAKLRLADRPVGGHWPVVF